MEMSPLAFGSKRLAVKAAWLVVAIFLVNLAAMKFFWYSSIWWFDMPMHFVGGVFLGLITLAMYLRAKKGEAVSTHGFVLVVAMTLLFGIGWEIFEFGIDTFITFSQHNLLDTVSDVCFDLAGACAVFVYARIKQFI